MAFSFANRVYQRPKLQTIKAVDQCTPRECTVGLLLEADLNIFFWEMRSKPIGACVDPKADTFSWKKLFLKPNFWELQSVSWSCRKAGMKYNQWRNRKAFVSCEDFIVHFIKTN